MRKVIGYAFLALLIIAGLIAYNAYTKVMKSSVPDPLANPYIHFPTDANYAQVADSLYQRGWIQDTMAFRLLAEKMNFKRDPMRSGRFKAQPGWTMIDLIRHLRSGAQEPIEVVLNGARMTENLAAKAARFIEPDSLTIQALLSDEDFLSSIGRTPETLMCLFIPNTYELYWNSGAEEFVSRMEREYERFWDAADRREKAKAMGMTECEVYTLASIVEKETNQNSEKKRMAGVYLNRLKIGMLLQADPTSVFATKDFTTKRVTDYHTKFDSPYNTYRYAGLPPGPIAQASIASIDAVLNAESHDYLYFCAAGDGTGLHNFARTLSQHNQNAATYRKNLKARGLR